MHIRNDDAQRFAIPHSASIERVSKAGLIFYPLHYVVNTLQLLVTVNLEKNALAGKRQRRRWRALPAESRVACSIFLPDTPGKLVVLHLHTLLLTIRKSQ